jgi:phosphoribosylformylglycinamidine cyclo-ligase
MVVDDIVVVGAKPLFMTDYIACGRVVPERIAAIVAGIARACAETGTALVGGETAEHPGLLGPDDYDVAGAAVGAVESSAQLGPHLVQDGDVVVAIASSGLHSNGFSLVRHILAKNGIGYTDQSDTLGGIAGEVLLEPTRLYTAPLLRLLSDPSGGAVHALSHVTGGGIAANLARVLPVGAWVEVDRRTWSPAPVFRALADLGGMRLAETEGTWNLGMGMIAVVSAGSENAVIRTLEADGLASWAAGTVSFGKLPSNSSGAGDEPFEQGVKGVNGGAVRLVGSYPS